MSEFVHRGYRVSVTKERTTMGMWVYDLDLVGGDIDGLGHLGSAVYDSSRAMPLAITLAKVRLDAVIDAKQEAQADHD